MPIGISRRSCAVEFLDKPSKSDENRAIALSLQERDMPISLLNSLPAAGRGPDRRP